MGIFDGVSVAKTSRQSSYFQPGHYLWRIDVTKADKNRKGEPFFACECTVVHVFDDANGLGHHVRETASWVIKQASDYFLGDIRAFLIACTGCDETQMTAQDWDEACAALISDDQPLAGVVVETINTGTVTKKGNPFTKINWKRAWTPEEIVAEVPSNIAAWLGLVAE